MVTYAWRQSCFSSDVARVSYERKTPCLTTLFRRSIEGVGQESRGWGTEEWMLTLTLPPRHLPFLKVAKKSYFKKSTNVPIYSRGLRSTFHFEKFRKTEVWKLTLALPRHLSREKNHPQRPSFPKNFSIQCYKIPPWLFHVPKNPLPTFYELMLQDFLFSFLLP